MRAAHENVVPLFVYLIFYEFFEWVHRVLHMYVCVPVSVRVCV